MFSPSAQSRARVLLIEANHVSLFRWQRGALKPFAQFTQSPADFTRFENLLHTEARVPFIVVVDCIEEDFRIETVAHVTGTDRDKMLERKLNFAFRTTQYKIARIVGREKDGRKDDRVLLTALTKTELLEPWVSRILKEKLAIKCVTSAAYMMELLAASLQLKSKAHILLVNIESGSGMRQTYLQKGRVIFSRLTPITERNDADLAAMLSQQSVQTRKYLERIKQLPYDQILPVHILAFGEPEFELPPPGAEDQLSFQVAHIEKLVAHSSLQLGEALPGALAVSLVQAMRGKGLRNVYAQTTQRRYYLLNGISTALYAAAAVAVAIAMLMIAPTIQETLSLWEQETDVAMRTQPLMQQYEQLRASFPETPIESSTMALVVDTHDLLLSQASDPREMLQAIGSVLMNLPRLQLRDIEWELLPIPPTQEELLTLPALTDSPGAPLRFALLSGRTELMATVSGSISGAEDFRTAREDMLTLISQLETSHGYRINQLEMPIEVRSDLAVSTLVGDEDVSETFRLEIIQGAKQDESP